MAARSYRGVILSERSESKDLLLLFLSDETFTGCPILCALSAQRVGDHHHPPHKHPTAPKC